MKLLEKEFRRKIIQTANRYPNGFAQSIETGTGSGIPDLFYCINGYCAWLELKSTEGSRNYMRISQWSWMRALYKAKGLGYLLILRNKNKKYGEYTIDVYAPKDLCAEERLIDATFDHDNIFFIKDINKHTVICEADFSGLHKYLAERLEKDTRELRKRRK